MSDRSHRSPRRRACLLALVLAMAGCQGPRVIFIAIAVQPAKLAFSTTWPSPAVEQTVEVTATGVGENLVISSIALAETDDLSLPASELLTTDCEGNPRTTTKPLQLAPLECARFSVRYSPTVAESITNTVIIQSNAVLTPVVKVPITAINEAPPEKCPAANLPVAEITASSSVTGPLAANGSTPPATVTVSGAQSTATTGATIVGYDWSLIKGPIASPMVLSGETLPLDANEVGSYTVGLIVADSNGCLSPPVTFPFQVSIPPCYMITPPTTAVAAFVGTNPVPPTGVLAQTVVSLASDSQAGTHPIATYNWGIVSAPPGNTSAIVPAGPDASLNVTEPGTYVVGLTVADGTGCASAQATASILVLALPLTCGPSTQFIYTVDTNTPPTLYQFSPSTVTMTPLGTLDCPVTDGTTPNTMGVDRQGIAWVEYEDGNVFRVDTTTLECFATSFNPTPLSAAQKSWGSCFAASGPDSNIATYYIAEAGALATIDTQTMTITQIGPFNGLSGSNQATEGELTGTSTGQLFGFFPGTPWVLAGIDKTSGNIVSQIPLEAITANASTISGWAFASWGQDFWFFAGDTGTTGIYHYDAMTAVTTEVTTYPAEIVGAGVSPCVQE